MLQLPMPSYAAGLAALLLACKPEARTADSADEGPRYASEFTAVTLDADSTAPFKLAVHACAGLDNRALGGSVYLQTDSNDEEWLGELELSPAEVVSAEDFLEGCAARHPCVPYDYATQQEILPSILTAATALAALPMDQGLASTCSEVAFDASVELAEATTPLLATRAVFERYAAETTGLAMLNPGYNPNAEDKGHPDLTQDMSAAMVDFVFSERLFALFLVNGCVSGEAENALFQEIVDASSWPTPIGVYGYNDSWLVGGYLYEAQTRCLESRNMGAIPTKVSNLSFFSTRRAPIEAPGELVQNEQEDLSWDPDTTYVAFIIGDGDNVHYILSKRNVWLRQRLDACAASGGACPPITWTISPHLPHLAPDVLEWYYASSRQTGSDFFALPPSGHLYAYPTSLDAADQDRFVAATERDAEILDAHSTVHWEWFDSWGEAESSFLPKYAAGGQIRGVIPVNVPYLLDAFPDWPEDRSYEVLDGGVVLFRPRQWRGVDDSDDEFFLSPARMAEDLGAWPRGSVLAVYMTSDGGLDLENSFLYLVDLLPEHIKLVSADSAASLALEASAR